jgi:hypothetical protein
MSRALRMKTQLNLALRRHLNTHSFYSLYVFLCFRMIRNFYSSLYCINSVYSVCFEYIYFVFVTYYTSFFHSDKVLGPYDLRNCVCVYVYR